MTFAHHLVAQAEYPVARLVKAGRLDADDDAITAVCTVVVRSVLTELASREADLASMSSTSEERVCSAAREMDYASAAIELEEQGDVAG